MSQPVAPRPYDTGRPPYPPRPVSTSTTGAKVMTTVGIVLTVIAIALVVAGIVRLADTVSDDALELRNGRDAVVETRADIPGPLTFDAEGDSTYAVLFFGDSRDEVDVDDLTVTGPDGRDVDLSQSSMTYTTSSSHSMTSKVATFDADRAGEYVLTVDGPSASIDGELAILDDELVAQLVVGAISGALLIVAGVLSGMVGLGLAIGGGVWWSVRRSAARSVGR